MAPVYSKYLTRNNGYVAAAVAATSWLLYSKIKAKQESAIRSKRKPAQNVEEIEYKITEKKEVKVKAHVNLEFFRQVKELLKIVIPGWKSKESGLLVLIACSLVARSLCDLYMIHHFSTIESAIVGMNKQLFNHRMLRFLMVMPVIAIINNTLKYAVGELKINITSNMTYHLYEDYLNKFTYYRISNLDKRISNVDQLLTTDVNKFCETLTDLYCNITKPILDVSIYVYKLNTNLGYSTPGLMFLYLGVAAVVLTRVRRPVGSLTVNEQKLEGEFRHINSRLITHSEEIAFYNGNLREKNILISSFTKLIRHLRKFLQFRVLMGVVDNIVAKYFAFFIGYIAMAIPFVFGTFGVKQLGVENRSLLYYAYGTMMVRLGQAVGRLALGGRELTKLAGYTVRITQLRTVLAELNEDKYERAMISGYDIKNNTGKLIFKNNIIKFDRVPIITPNGDVLINEVSVEVKSGMNVLVCGPNGAGKSSLFRILGELWPLFGGELTKPPRGKLFYIPQRPYMTLGSLRDQVTYPHSTSEAKRRGCTDAKLEQHLKRVQLDYLLEREGRFDAVEDWLEVLSGGEKQRIAMARLFYHAPQFAILDECTSAVSLDVEESMYKYCREVGITLLTVSHRKSLWQHHEYVLYLDGRGSYSFKPIEDDMEKFGS